MMERYHAISRLSREATGCSGDCLDEYWLSLETVWIGLAVSRDCLEKQLAVPETVWTSTWLSNWHILSRVSQIDGVGMLIY